ncbi:MAG: ABC transporter ATP-binding protein [Candidatus Methanoplasma sp.]|jgi:iron complex transport system ATP-binding protein|nr:ABC transporter ATP-binding protein [Candidatus Methanoplasma sp.]
MRCDAEGDGMLSVSEMRFGYSGEDTLKSIGFAVGPGEFVALMGPNGSGKTTMMRCINRVLKVRGGSIEIGGDDVLSLSLEDLAKVCATVPADASLDFVLTVRDFVSLGRSPYVTNIWWDSREDEEMVDRALRDFGIAGYAGRRLSEVSSGERARVLLAKGVVQTPKVMLVDEPSAHLDIKYKIQVMEILKKLSRKGLSIVIASHDINLLTRFCDRVMLLSRGRIVGYGPPAEVVTEESIREVFDIEVKTVMSDGVVYVLPTGSTMDLDL